MRKIERENTGRMEPGQNLVVAGYAGYAGTVEIVRQKHGELLTWFTESYLDRIMENEDGTLSGNLERWKAFGATECEPAGEGGILSALWNLSGAYMTGIEFSLRQIPVKQETIEVCERYNLNPYRLYSDGCLLFVTDNGGEMVLSLEREGLHAAVIGRVTEGIGRIIRQGERTGYLDRPAADEIHKVLSAVMIINHFNQEVRL